MKVTKLVHNENGILGAKCHTKFRGERSLLQVCCKLFASSLQVFCIEFRLTVRRNAKNDTRIVPKINKNEAWGVPKFMEMYKKCDLGAAGRL
jgi:hypothetical protein